MRSGLLSAAALALCALVGCSERASEQPGEPDPRDASAAPSGAGEAAQGETAGSREAPQEGPQERKGRWFVAAANPYAAEAGAKILRRGGSAVDAAVAVQTVLGLVEPQSSGLGGGAFMLHFDPASDELITLSGRETAPASARPDRFLTEDGAPMNFYDAVAGGLSVGVPGAVRMLALAHERHGEIAWGDLFAPAIALSEDGFDVSPRLNDLLGRIPRLKQLPAAAAYFYDADGAPHPVGHTLRNPAYAQTLRAIAEEGADAFYEGEIAREIVAAVNNAPNPGGMTLEDMSSYRAELVDPVCAPYRGYRVCSMAPPSSGGVTTLQILAMLEPFDMAGAGALTIESLHLLFEASRLAYADRNRYVADNASLADEGGLGPEEVVAGLLNADYLAARAALIAREARMEEAAPGDPAPYLDGTSAGWSQFGDDASPEPPSTSHFTIVDAEGRVVSMTTTVEFAFGSHLMAGGMILNNQLTDFSFEPERDGAPVANAVGPGKRPRSSMSPVMIFDEEGDFYAALGSPGGPAIIGYVVKTILALIDWGMELDEAIALANAVYPRGAPILEEDAFDAQTIAGLRALGHEPTQRALTSGVHAVRMRADGGYEGGADPRREGVYLTGVVAEALPAE